jgi:VanZ family protein
MAVRLRWFGLWLGVGWALVATVVYLSLTGSPPQADVPNWDKIGHVLAYFALMVWFADLYPRRRATAAMALAVMGFTLEGLQGLGGVRTPEAADMLANLSGVMLGWGLALVGLRPPTLAEQWLGRLRR